MKNLLIGLAFLPAACGGTPVYLTTSPGAALPGFIAACNKNDSLGRCSDWSSKTEYCVHPKGVNEPEPIIPCAMIHDGKVDESEVKKWTKDRNSVEASKN